MIYRSNLLCPDLTPQFAPHLDVRVRPWSMGHDVPSHATHEPECCFITHDEGAILHHIAKLNPGDWYDIGSRFLWSTLHVWEAVKGHDIFAVDPMYGDRKILDQAIKFLGRELLCDIHIKVELPQYRLYSATGAFIDGNHDAPYPLVDAVLMHRVAACDVIVFHDAWGAPIQEAVRYLIGEGYKAHLYLTPNGVFACTRGDVRLPPHVPDPAIDWSEVMRSRVSGGIVSGTCTHDLVAGGVL